MAVFQIIGTRLAVAAGLLGLLIVAELVVPEILPLMVCVALIVLPIVQWAAVGFFAARTLEDPSILALRARTQDAVALALAQTVGAALGLIVVLRAFSIITPIDRGVFLVGLSFALLMIAAPAVNWLLTWKPWRSA